MAWSLMSWTLEPFINFVFKVKVVKEHSIHFNWSDLIDLMDF